MNKYKYLILILCVIISSCVHGRLQRLEIDEKFNYSTIIQKKIYFAKIIDNTGCTEFGNLDKIANGCFIYHRKVYRDTYSAHFRTQELVNGAGLQNSYVEAMREFTSSSYINPSRIKELYKALGDNYLAFIRLDSYNVYSTNDESTSSDLSGRVIIYNCSDGSVVFNGYNIETYTTYKAKDENDKNCILPSSSPPPQPVKAERMAIYFFDSFAINIPDKGDDVSKWYKKYDYIFPVEQLKNNDQGPM